MQTDKQTINQWLVALFNEILRIEEQTLDTPGLSIREVHVIEAVCRLGRPRMTDLARALRITAGSATVAVNALVRKGYLQRERSQEDLRAVCIQPTEKALQVQRRHQIFHQEMVEAVVSQLGEEELPILVKALNAVESYFVQKERGHS